MADEISLNKGWSLDAYIAHNESMRTADLQFAVERDRRYSEMLAAAEKAISAALISAKEAVTKAEAASEKRFEGVNEFRATLADQAATLISRNEVEQQFKALNEKMDTIASRMDRGEGREGGTTKSWAYLVAGIGALGTIVAIVIGIITVVILTGKT